MPDLPDSGIKVFADGADLERILELAEDPRIWGSRRIRR